MQSSIISVEGLYFMVNREEQEVKRLFCICFVFIFLLSSCSSSELGEALSNNKLDRKNDLSQFRGQWKGIYESGQNEIYDIVLDIDPNNSEEKVLFSSDSWNCYFFPVNWEVKNGQMILSMNDETHRVIISLSFNDSKMLCGTYEQYGNSYVLSLDKASDTPAFGKFYRNTYTFAELERKQQLVDYATYAEDDVTISFTYDLNNRTEYENIIKEYNLDKLTDGMTDVDLMIALLNWVCDNFRHNGSSGMPKQRNANMIIDYCKQNPSGINCRGLSILLAEMCRVYGIPSKHITCMPKEALFDECHVVVHAYSEELGQWIMLDPTYRLILQDEKGDYINLSMLRNFLINDINLIPNENAGRNGNVFDINNYRTYMTKNTFRFSSATDFYYGAEDGYNGNVDNMLIPVNYTDGDSERTTTSDGVFWQIP